MKNSEAEKSEVTYQKTESKSTVDFRFKPD